MNRDLQQHLLSLVAEEQRVHSELTATGEIFRGYAPRLAEVDRRNAAELERIIQQDGWPGTTLVGEEGAHAAWLIVQHAIANPAFQRKCLPLLREAAELGEARPAHAAYLEDKIAFFERRPQRYGTQFDWDEDGEMSPWTLEDPAKVDAYRRSVGLGPLAEKIEQFRREMTEETKPKDLKQYRQGQEQWAKLVGWL